MIQKVTDHVARGLSRFIEQDKNRTRLKKFATIFFRRVQELEDATYEVLTKRTLDDSGAQLDAIGAIVGASRGALDDTNFLIIIRAMIQLLRSNGTPVDQVSMMQLCLPPGYTFTYSDGGGSGVFHITERVLFSPLVLLSMLRAGKPGGFRAILEFSIFPPAQTFIFEEQGGWGHVGSSTIGGRLECGLLGGAASVPEPSGGRPMGQIPVHGGVATEPADAFGLVPESYQEEELNWIFGQIRAFHDPHDGIECLNFSDRSFVVGGPGVSHDGFVKSRLGQVLAYDPEHRCWLFAGQDHVVNTDPFFGASPIDEDFGTYFTLSDWVPPDPLLTISGWDISLCHMAACADDGTVLLSTLGQASNPALLATYHWILSPTMVATTLFYTTVGSTGSPVGSRSYCSVWDQENERFWVGMSTGANPALWVATKEDDWTQITIPHAADYATPILQIAIGGGVRAAATIDALWLIPNASSDAKHYAVATMLKGETEIVGLHYSVGDRMFLLSTPTALYASPNAFAWQKVYTLPDGWTHSPMAPSDNTRGGISSQGGCAVVAAAFARADGSTAYFLRVSRNALREWVAIPFPSSVNANNPIHSVTNAGGRVFVVSHSGFGVLATHHSMVIR